MKTLFLLAFSICFANVFGQTSTDKFNESITDSSAGLRNNAALKVIYENKNNSINKPAYFLNGELMSETLLLTLYPRFIGSINVVKGNIQIDNVLYYGKVEIETKTNYSPKVISLRALKEKYANLKGKSAIFMIDGVIINADYDKALVDENYLLTITVEKVENTKENIDLGFIKLLTKSEENIKKSKEIRIRGADVTFVK